MPRGNILTVDVHVIQNSVQCIYESVLNLQLVLNDIQVVAK